MEFVPLPKAINNEPFHATPFPLLEKIDVPIPVHDVKLDEYAIEFVPFPTATHKLLL
jgi:hypothetical protein